MEYESYLSLVKENFGESYDIWIENKNKAGWQTNNTIKYKHFKTTGESKRKLLLLSLVSWFESKIFQNLWATFWGYFWEGVAFRVNPATKTWKAKSFA